MEVDAELLEILRCPESQGELEVVELPAEVRTQLVEKFREHFRDEEPKVECGLLSRKAALVYPVVSDIPVMLVEEALPQSILGASGSP